MRFFIIFLFPFFLHADFLYTKASNRCVYDLHPRSGGSGWCYTFSDTNKSSCRSRSKRVHFLDGYYYNGSDCVLNVNLAKTDLSYKDYKFLIALSGFFFGFIFFLGLLYVL